MLDRVVLGAHTYSVHFLERLSKKRRVGEANVVENTILLRNDQSASNLRSTMLHEIAHHIYWLGGMRFVEGWSEGLEEAAVCALEGPLLELFTRVENGPLRDWLQS